MGTISRMLEKVYIRLDDIDRRVTRLEHLGGSDITPGMVEAGIAAMWEFELDGFEPSEWRRAIRAGFSAMTSAEVHNAYMREWRRKERLGK